MLFFGIMCIKVIVNFVEKIRKPNSINIYYLMLCTDGPAIYRVCSNHIRATIVPYLDYRNSFLPGYPHHLPCSPLIHSPHRGHRSIENEHLIMSCHLLKHLWWGPIRMKSKLRNTASMITHKRAQVVQLHHVTHPALHSTKGFFPFPEHALLSPARTLTEAAPSAWNTVLWAW